MFIYFGIYPALATTKAPSLRGHGSRSIILLRGGHVRDIHVSYPCPQNANPALPQTPSISAIHRNPEYQYELLFYGMFVQVDMRIEMLTPTTRAYGIFV